MAKKFTLEERQAIKCMPCVGYWSTLGGVEVKEIEHGIDDYVICVSSAWYGGDDAKSIHHAKVKYDKRNRPFIRILGENLYLEECLRSGV